jgi:putative ABC transport system permease protein
LGTLTRALRNVSRRKARTLLVVIALGFSMAIMISIPPGIVANQESTQNLTEDYNNMLSSMQEEINKTATLIECSTSSGQGFSSGRPSGDFQGMPPSSSQQTVFVNETVVSEIQSIEGVKDIVEYLEESSNETTSETISSPRGDFTVSRPIYTITGVSLNSYFLDNYSILPTEVTSGRNLQTADSRVVLVSSNLSSYLGIGVDSKIEIYGESFTVVGIFAPTSQGRFETRIVYMNITDAQIITGNTGNASRLDIYAESASYVDGIADVIKATYTDLYVTTYKDRLANLERMQEMYTETLSNAQSTIAQTQSTATEVIVVAVAATSLIVLFVMLYTVRERTKEIGTLKAIGFSNWNVMSQFILEGIIISLIAGVVGIAIGSIAAPTLTSLLLPRISMFGGQRSNGFFPGAADSGVTVSQAITTTLDPQWMLLAFGIAVLLGALGSLYPAWRASRTSPMEALKYE